MAVLPFARPKPKPRRISELVARADSTSADELRAEITRVMREFLADSDAAGAEEARQLRRLVFLGALISRFLFSADGLLPRDPDHRI
jgi:hypothetical protein